MRRIPVVMGLLAAVFAGGPDVSAQKYGGVLRIISFTNPPGLQIHATATAATQIPAMPQYNNLALLDQLTPVGTVDDIKPDLAQSWSWSRDGRALTFRLRRGVTWHDGKPFTAKDVQHTFDVARGASQQKFKINPRKIWWDSIDQIVSKGDNEVTFRLKRPQPALLSLLSAGYSPVLPAHVPVNKLRQKPVGTGPFRMVSYERDKAIHLRKNKAYFVKGRPYLDGIDIIIIKSKATRISAMQAGQADISAMYDVTDKVKDRLAKANPNLKFSYAVSNGSQNVLLNHKRKPFTDPRYRMVFALALDHAGYVKSVYQGMGVPGGGMLTPPPNGRWGLTGDLARQVPGRGGDADKEKARQILRKLGHGPDNPLKLTLTTRGISLYVDTAVWVTGELQKVGIETTLEQVETAAWFAKLARQDYVLALNGTTLGVDDPDVAFFENFSCASARNYTNYCNLALEKKMLRQSGMKNMDERLKLVQEIDLEMQLDVARPILGHAGRYSAYQPYVKNYVRHAVNMDFHRYQDVWLDK